MQKGNLVAFVLILFAWVLLIVAYSSYWYQIKDSSGNIEYYKSDKVKLYVDVVDDSDTRGYTSYEKKTLRKNFIEILKASLSFAVISWIINTVALVFLLMSAFGLLSKIPIPFLGLFAKFLPIAGLVLCLLSLFIFLGVPSARMKDCKRVIADGACEDSKINKELVGEQFGLKWNPTVGWAAVVVSAVFNLAGALCTILIASF
eukprot:gene8599-10585_t